MRHGDDFERASASSSDKHHRSTFSIVNSCYQSLKAGVIKHGLVYYDVGCIDELSCHKTMCMIGRWGPCYGEVHPVYAEHVTIRQTGRTCVPDHFQIYQWRNFNAIGCV